MRKVKQIQTLVERLPGSNRGEEQQEEEVRRLSEEVRAVERERKESRRQMRELAKRLDDVVLGMSMNIEPGVGSNGQITPG